MKINKKWALPKPPKGVQYSWHPVIRLGNYIPFGYQQDPQDKDTLLPIPEQLELLEKAKEHLKKYSLREVADWLSSQSGRRISHEGLRKRLKVEKRRQRDFANAKLYAEKAKEASQKAERIAQSLGGPSSRGYQTD